MVQGKMKSFDSFDDWLRDQSVENSKIVANLRKLVAAVAPNLGETSKWGNGCWQKGTLPILYLYAGSDHLQFGFFGGAFLKDPKKILKGKGKFVRHIRIETAKDIDEVILASMIRKAVRAPSYR